MFPQKQRIHSTHDVIQVLRQGKKIRRGSLTCYFLAKPATLSRVTVIVDTKVSKKATERNLLKRQTRAILQSLDLPKGDIIIRLYTGSQGLQFPHLLQSLTQCIASLPSRNGLYSG